MEVTVTLEELRKRKIFIGTPMYGGMCTGGYCHSVADLRGLAVKYGVDIKLHYIYNESLITRARNYITDEFLRSKYTHLMFIDADITFNPDDVFALAALSGNADGTTDKHVMCGPYPKKSCSFRTKVLTETGPRKIVDLVREKYSGRVWTYGPNGFELNRVVGHSKEKVPGKKWVKIHFNGVGNRLRLTEDHECATIDNILFPGEIQWREAKDMGGAFILRFPKKGEYRLNTNPLYGEEQMSFLIGTLLGDGNLSKKGLPKFGHADSQLEYLKLKQELFGGSKLMGVNTGFYRGSKSKAYKMHLPMNGQMSHLRRVMYPNGKKVLTNVLPHVDGRGLAFWYMDDGYTSKQTSSGLLCTECFSYEEHVALQTHLKTRFDVESTIREKGSKNKGIYRLYIPSSNGNGNKFFSLIAPYVPACMEYKLPEAHRGGRKHAFKTDWLPYGAAEIIEVEDIGETGEYQYDIGVENNHNFVANDSVVHNCISWEKIKRAVDRGFADKDPNTLERFVGDYVFNPAPGTDEIKIGEPAEILESGTGFMMIRRDCLEGFAEKRPELRYIPDHVRSEHFDGSREITGFFHDTIDQVSRRWLSEDYWFCQEVRKMGYKVWLCPWMRTQHMGAYVFGGSLEDMAMLGVSPTADPSALFKGKKSKSKGDKK